MKKIIILVALLALFISLCNSNIGKSQSNANDVSVWFKVNDQKQVSSFVWGTYLSPENIFFDYRWNFDVDNAIGVYVGKAFTFSNKSNSQEMTIIPEIGVVYTHQEYLGLSPEVQGYGHLNNAIFYSLTQYVKDFQHSADFIYSYLEIGYQFNKVKAGLSGDLMYDVPTKSAKKKFGPYLTIPINNFYIKLQANINPKGDFVNTLTAVGFTF